MFTAALCTIAKTWKQPKRSPTEEWMKKRWYIHTMEYYSAIKNDIMPFAVTWMDLETIILNEVSQWKTNIILYHLHLGYIFLKGHKLTYLQNRNKFTDFEKLLVTKGDRWRVGGMGWGFGTGICTLRYMEWLAKGDLLYSTGNYTQYSVIIYVGKESKRMAMCMCMTGSLCCTEEIIADL